MSGGHDGSRPGSRAGDQPGGQPQGTPKALEILPVEGIGEVGPGDDLPALITAAAPWLRDGDVLVVTSKIVSKAEGRLVDLPPAGPARDAARRDVLAAETARTVAARGGTRIVQTHHGFVMANAGIDSSNVEPDRVVLLPKDPDASARHLRTELRERYGLDVAVVVSDTMGRPWRLGLTDVALGAAGIGALRDHRGQVDPYGNELHLTQMAVVDQLAGAAELVKGKRDRVPVAVVRGYPVPPATPVDAPDGGVAALIRGAAQDLFSLGTAEARAAGLRAAAGLPDAPAQASPPAEVDAMAVNRAIGAVTAALGPDTVLASEPGGVRCAVPQTAGPAALIRLGADAHRLRAALAAEGVASWVRPAEHDVTAVVVAIG
ncbi:coenzyme F420-0:L-glutamate ligase [Rhizomonospora bruguierae]|uniref:coenzyme F420-0:L-glutamate ligase n=1 Tax=Rhizomonospora bruguierae TaxID=1581705 RepID=UPI001BD043E7|nr:coenzyme F420-0:L-glutamate ligase [Micromonospora sp. NBRC 107566]